MWLQSLGASRLALLAMLVTVGLGFSVAQSPGRARGHGALEEVRAALEGRGLVVAPGEIAWEKSEPQGLTGALVPARALALGAKRAGDPRDLYRVEARLSPTGVPLSISTPKNLTRTPLGDDLGLVVSPPFAAYATTAYGQVQAVTILDLRGQAPVAVSALDSVGRAEAAVSDYLATGDAQGVGRTVISLAKATDRVSLGWADGAKLEISWSDDSALVDARSGEVLRGSNVVTERAVHTPKASILWLVDTVRSFTGPGTITWLEARTFALAGFGRRLARGEDAFGSGSRRFRPISRRSSRPAGTGSVWPPPPIEPDLEPPASGEGQWRASAPPYVKRLPGAPPAFYETFVRVDPYTRVYIVAADLRQMELGMVAGAEDPEPTVGPPGTGRLPRRAAVLDNVVAAFNGAFKSKHGSYGMVEEKRVLLPPLHGAATLTTHADGRIGVGSWPGDWRIPADVVSLRQNLDPLVDRGVLNPSGRRIWGFPLPEMESMETGRSGVCISRAGHLMYFFGIDLGGPLLGRAMLLAGCSYGIHLDMNPYHCSFIYARIRDSRAWLAATGEPARAKLLGLPRGDELYDAQMMHRGMMDPRRFLVRSPKDFFYLALRAPTLPPGGGIGISWSSSGLRQPEPAFLPSFHRGTRGEVELWSLASRRGRLAVRAGSSETSEAVGAAPPTSFAPEPDRLPLLAVASSARGGLVVAGRVVHGDRAGVPTIAMRRDGSLAIGPWPIDGAEEALAGEPLEDAPAGALGTAVGLDPSGRLTVARGPARDLGAALESAGATANVLVARSDREPRVIADDAGGVHDDRTLYLVPAPPGPMAFRIDRPDGDL